MKKIFLPVGIVLLLCMAFALTGCLAEEGALPPYTYSYDSIATIETDDGMTVDGHLDESVYQNQRYMTFSQSGVTVSFTTVFGEKGLYIGAVADDRYVYYNVPYLMTANTGMEVFVTTSENTVRDTTVLELAADTHNQWAGAYAAFIGKSVVRGNAENTGLSDGISSEFFIPWEQLGLTGKPDRVKLMPGYNHVTALGASSGLKIRPVGNVNKPINYYMFDENGYINLDAEGAIVGDSVTGISKSCGWDLTGLANEYPSVRSVEDDAQFIFFKDANSDKFLIEAVVTPKSILRGNVGAKVGLMIGYDGDPMSYTSTYNEKAGFMLDLAQTNYNGDPNEVDKVKAKIIDFFRAGWVASGYVYSNTKDAKKGGLNYEDGIRLKVLKYNETFFFYINDELVFIDKRDYLAAEVMPGLFTIGCEAEFSSLRYVDYSDRSDELLALISHDAYLVQIDSSAGGKTSSDTMAIMKHIDPSTMLSATTDVNLSLTADTGYRLTGFSLNGEDTLASARSDMRDGTYSLENVAEDLTVHTVYEKIDPAALSSVKISVGLSGQGTVNPATATLTVTGKDDRTVYLVPRLSLVNAAGGKLGSATVKLPAGTYLFRFVLDGFHTKTTEVTVTETGTYTPDPVILVPRTSYGTSVSGSYEGQAWELDTTGTIDYTREEENVLALGDNANLFFSDTASKWIMNVRIGDVRRATGKSDLKAGVIVAAFCDVRGVVYRYSVVVDGNNRDVKLLTQVTGQDNLWSDFRPLDADITSSEGVELTVLRDGEEIHLFLDGTYVETIQIGISAKAGVGFITVGSTAVFRDHSYITDFTDSQNAAEYKRLMRLKELSGK